jgi:FPC/CPF motif-containing protein YcgG
VLVGYAVSGEPTLKAFYERLAPFAEPFMALFGRNQLPHRSTLSRFLAALNQPTVEALRTLFQKDLLARKPFSSPGGLFDRTGEQRLVVDVDGTRQAARQRALPQTDALPVPHRRFDQVCAPGYQGRKRGEVIRTRTVVLQAHTHQFLGTFGGRGNGDYRGELRRAIQVISSYATQLGLPTASVLVRLDGLYGDAAPLIDVLSAGLGVIARSRAYHEARI